MLDLSKENFFDVYQGQVNDIRFLSYFAFPDFSPIATNRLQENFMRLRYLCGKLLTSRKQIKVYFCQSLPEKHYNCKVIYYIVNYLS